MSGILWTRGAKWDGRAATWIPTPVVARAIGPDPYGLVGMALIYVWLGPMLGEFGIGSAVVTLRTMTRDQIAQVNSLAVGFGLVRRSSHWAQPTFVGLGA